MSNKKVESKKSKKSKSEKTAKAAPKAVKIIAPTREPAMIPIDALVSPPKRLVVRDVRANLDELTQSLKREKQLTPLLVRPTSGGKYEVLDGHNRWSCMRDIGMKQVSVLIARDLVDDNAALGAIVIANSDGHRANLTPIEMAHVFHKLMETEIKSGGKEGAQTRVAKRCGTSSNNVMRHLRLLDVPKDVQSLVQAGEMSKDAAFAYAKVSETDDKAAKHVLEAIKTGTVLTAADVQRTAADFDRQNTESTGDSKESGKKRKSVGPARVWLGAREIEPIYRDMLGEYAVCMAFIPDADGHKAKDNDRAGFLRSQLIVFAFIMGHIDADMSDDAEYRLDPESPKFVKLIDTLAKDYAQTLAAETTTPIDGDEPDDEEPSKKKGSKKTEKGKKNSKKKVAVTAGGSSDFEDPEDDRHESDDNDDIDDEEGDDHTGLDDDDEDEGGSDDEDAE